MVETHQIDAAGPVIVEAFGQDVLERASDGTVSLSSPASKGWLARQEGTLTKAEHPGTAVRWGGGVFEVLEARPLSDGGVRYRLAPWDFRHAIRVIQPYDIASERERAQENSRRRESIWQRRLSILFSPLLGHLPGPVQERMESEFGAPAAAMTIVSALPLFILGFLGAFSYLVAAFGGGLAAENSQAARILPWEIPLPIALYLTLESVLRLGSAFLAGHPMGSLPGALAYELWSHRRGRRTTAPLSSTGSPGSAQQETQDRYRMLEPLLALLSPQEQELLESRFGFDPLRWGKITAVVLLAISGLGVLISLAALLGGVGGFGDLLVLLLGAGLFLEQIHRQKEISRGHPTGSVLGGLVRPLAASLLSRAENSPE